jgi:hypothetical protein
MEALATVSWRRIALYYGLSAVLGLYLYVHHLWTTPNLPEAKTDTTPIADIDSQRPDTVVLEHRGLEVEAGRLGRRWVLRKPPGLSVTSDLLDALIDTLTTIPPIEIVADASAKDEEYGLSPPLTHVELLSGGKVLASLYLGKRNPTRTAVYAGREGDDRVYLLGLNAQYYVELIYEDISRQMAGQADTQ